MLLKQKELAFSTQKTMTETPKKKRKKKSPERRKRRGRQCPTIRCRHSERCSKPPCPARLKLAQDIPWWCDQVGLKDALSDSIPSSIERSFSLQGKRHRNVPFVYWLRWHFWITVPYNSVFPMSKIHSSPCPPQSLILANATCKVTFRLIKTALLFSLLITFIHGLHSNADPNFLP